MNNQTLDFIGLLTFLGSLLFAPAIAAVIGPYVGIIAAAGIGASFTLSRQEKMSRSGAFMFFCRVIGVAVLISVGAAKLLQNFVPFLNEVVMLIPVAFLIGLIGERWGAIGDAILSWALSRVTQKGQP